MSGITRQRLANIKVTTKVNLTGGKAKANGITNLVQSDDSIEIKDATLEQTFCNSSLFIYKTMKLKNLSISKIDKNTHIAHIKATVELSEPKCEVDKDANISSRWASFFASKAPSSRIESVDMDVPFEINEDESKVKVRFSTMGFSQKITATLV